MRGSSGGAHFAGGREFNCSWRYYLIEYLIWPMPNSIFRTHSA